MLFIGHTASDFGYVHICTFSLALVLCFSFSRIRRIGKCKVKKFIRRTPLSSLSLFFFVGRGNGGCVSTLKTRKYTYALAQKHVRIHAGPNIRCVINGRLLWLWVLLKHFFDLCISFTMVVSFSIAIEFVCLLLFSVSC